MVRYEDLSLEPYETMDNILQFLGLEPSPLIDKFLESHTLIQRSGMACMQNGASTFFPNATLPIIPCNICQQNCFSNTSIFF